MQALIKSRAVYPGDHRSMPGIFPAKLPPPPVQKQLEQKIDRPQKPQPVPGGTGPSLPVVEKFGPGIAVDREDPVIPETRGVADPAWTDRPLVAVIRVAPDYPPAAAKDGRKGWVAVRFLVGTDGTVSNLEIVARNHTVFDRATIRAAARFGYSATVVGGQAVVTHGVQTMFRCGMGKEGNRQ